MNQLNPSVMLVELDLGYVEGVTGGMVEFCIDSLGLLLG